MGIRKYSSIASEKTLSAELPATGLGSIANTLYLNSTEGLPSIALGSGDTYTMVLSPDTVDEEIVTVTAVSGTQLTVERAQEGTGPAKSHPEGRKARHMITGRDLQDAQNHFIATGTHGVTEIVGRTEAQTLLNKRLDTPKLNENVNLTATSTQLNALAGLTATPTELNYVAGVTSGIQAQITAVNTTVNTNTPVGTIVMYGAVAAPSGWLLCNGAPIPSQHTALINLIGANTPDLMGRIPMGYGSGSGLTARSTMFEKIGAETLPYHNHSIDHDHGAFATTDGAGSHTHQSNIEIAGSLANGGIWLAEVNTTPRGDYLQPAGGHNHTIDVPNFGGTSGPAGSGSHGVMQPSTVVNFIIKH